MTRGRGPAVALVSAGLLAGSLTALVTPSVANAAPGAVAGSAEVTAALPPLGPGDWPNRRNKPPGAGVNEAETAITVANAPGLHIQTVKPSAFNAFGGQAGATGHGLLFFGRPGGGIRAEDQVSGALRWTSTVGSVSMSVGETAVYTVGAPLVGSGSGVYALDASTGHQLWHKALAGVTFATPPTLVGNQLLVSWQNNQGANGRALVTSYNAATGAKLWQTKLPDRFGPSQASAGGNVAAVTSEDGIVQTLNLTTGALRWSYDAGAEGGGTSQSRPVIRGNRLFIGLLVPGFKGFVGAFDLNTGAPLWTRTFDVQPFFDLVENDGVLYLAALGDGTVDDLFALSSDTGATIWSKATGADGSPTLANGVLFLPTFFGGTALKTYAAAAGASLGATSVDTPVSEPMVSHGKVYLLEQDGDLDVFTP